MMVYKKQFILLAEDNRDDVDLVRRSFRKYNVYNEMAVVGDGVELLEFLFREGAYADRNDVMPSVVLVDIKMPRLNGLEALRRIRADDRTKLLPVVILTSSREEEEVVKAYAYGANSFVQKPVDFAQFSDAVRQLGLYWFLLNEPPPNDGKKSKGLK